MKTKRFLKIFAIQKKYLYLFLFASFVSILHESQINAQQKHTTGLEHENNCDSTHLSSNGVLRIVSHNLLFEKTIPSEEARQWKNRKKAVVEYFKDYGFDIVGTQEALTFQVNDILSALPDFGKIGLDLGGRTTNSNAENAAIFYRKNKLEVLDKGDFWFSATPDIAGSYSWNAGYPRKCTWAKFKIKATDQILYVFNSHFYVFDESHEAKTQCATILKEKIEQIAADAPVVVMGDFNATPDTKTIGILLTDNFLRDSKSLAKKQKDPHGTYHGFDVSSIPSTRIDYIMVNDKLAVLNYWVVDDELKSEKFTSDHLPVVADVFLK